MKKKIKMTNDRTSGRHLRLSYAVLSLLLIFLISFAVGMLADRLYREHQEHLRQRPLALFWEAWDILDEAFFGELPSDRQRTYGAIRGSLALLNDPYTIFLEPQPGAVERDRLAGAYGGIGVDLWRDAAGQVILSPFPASPAEQAGIRTGDILLAVDGASVVTETLDAIHVRLRGEAGTVVRLMISRPPTPPFDLDVTRAVIQVPSVTYRVLDQAPSIGYLHVTGFTGRTSDEVAQALQTLLSSGVASLVLDLRDNGGGLIEQAVAVADAFLDGGVILYEIRRGGQEQAFQAQRGGAASDIPLVVLVNGSTASAAEMVAGAIQARERGILIGEPTFGKGSVQLIYTLSDGSSLHVTAALWLLPDRQPLAPNGLEPDILVSPANGLEDTSLAQAIEFFTQGRE